MSPRPLALVAFAACSTWAQTGRVVDGPCWHLGARPASDGVGDYALTLQISNEWGPCPRERERRTP